MSTRSDRFRTHLLLVLLGLPVAVLGQTADIVQQLDSVDAVKSKQVLEMQVAEPGDCGDYDCATSDLPSSGVLASDDPLFEPTGGIPASSLSFAACQRAADRSMHCLLNSVSYAGQIRQPVTRWNESGDYDDVFDCTDPQLNLDRRRPNPCTSLTVDLAGNYWLGGRDGTAHSLIKVVRIPNGAPESACPAGFPMSGSTPAQPMRKLSRDFDDEYDYCFLRYATGRPVIVDMSVIDGTYGARFEGAADAELGRGVLLLEDRRTAVFVADKFASGAPVRPFPVELASGKAGFGLVGNESVQSVSVLQLCPTVVDDERKCAPGADWHNYLMATTSTGRVVARRLDADANQTVMPVQASARCTTTDPCPTSPSPQFWVRVSQQSGQVYVSDRAREEIARLSVPVGFPGSTTSFVLEDELSTVTSPGITLNSISVSPGIGVDLRDCEGPEPCVLAPNGGNVSEVGAELSNVRLVLDTTDPRSGLAVFKITGIPDCRQPPHFGAPYCPADATPGGGYLDVAPLLPAEVRELFANSTTPTLDDLTLLIGPQFRGRPTSDPETTNRFGAIFGRTEEGVVFRDTFDLRFDIGDLSLSGQTRCGFDPGTATQATTTSPKSAANWDPLITVSERYPVASSVNGTAAEPGGTLLHTDMLVNTDCVNPTSGSGDRWSLYAYGLMPAACVAGNTVPSLDPNQVSNACKLTFVDLLESLYDDLERARFLTACQNPDGNPAGAPLGEGHCAALKADWDAALPKLKKCRDAAVFFKRSATDENCQAFETQFLKYRQTLDSVTVNGGDAGDKANRVGELKARWDVIYYIYRDQFLPGTPFLPTP